MEIITQTLFIPPGMVNLKCFKEAAYFENRCCYHDSYYHSCPYNDIKHNERTEKNDSTSPPTSGSEN